MSKLVLVDSKGLTRMKTNGKVNCNPSLRHRAKRSGSEVEAICCLLIQGWDDDYIFQFQCSEDSFFAQFCEIIFYR